MTSAEAGEVRSVTKSHSPRLDEAVDEEGHPLRDIRAGLLHRRGARVMFTSPPVLAVLRRIELLEQRRPADASTAGCSGCCDPRGRCNGPTRRSRDAGRPTSPPQPGSRPRTRRDAATSRPAPCAGHGRHSRRCRASTRASGDRSRSRAAWRGVLALAGHVRAHALPGAVSGHRDRYQSSSGAMRRWRRGRPARPASDSRPGGPSWRSCARRASAFGP